MEKNEKVFIGILISILLVGAFTFGVMLITHNPPPRPEERETSKRQNSLEQDGSFAVENRNPVQSQGNGGKIQAPSEQLPADSDDYYATILVSVVDQNNNPAKGIRCKVFSFETTSPASLQELFAKEVDDKGECYFYQLDPQKGYSVKIYGDSTEASREVFRTSYIGQGMDIKREVSLSQNDPWFRNQNQMQAQNCTDSDGGYNPYVFGYVVAPDYQGIMRRVDDICLDSLVMEAICDQNGSANNARTYSCPKGCSAGRCLQ